MTGAAVPSSLSAVSAFFDSNPSEDNETRISDAREVPKKRTGSKKLGVGAVKKDPRPESTLLSKIMRIKNRKKRDDDEEEEVEDQEDSDDNDEGRTAIRDKITKRLESLDMVSPTPKKKKRKKTDMDSNPKNDSKSINASDAMATTATPEPNKPPAKSTASSDGKTKKKRPKVRSRQKNIYKDKRPLHEKPLHLVVGHKEYQGLPLTAQTRSRLSLPPSKRSQPPIQFEELAKPETDQTLAVDDLIAPPEDRVVESVVRKKKKKKRKKSKYKNLTI